MFIVHPLRFWREIPGIARQLGCRFKVFVCLRKVALCSEYAYTYCFGAERTADSAWCCRSFDLSYYDSSPSSDRCPVLSCMTFSGTPMWCICVAPVARRLWLVLFPSIPAALHIFLTLSFVYSVCLPTGVAEYHGAILMVLKWHFVVDARRCCHAQQLWVAIYLCRGHWYTFIMIRLRLSLELSQFQWSVFYFTSQTQHFPDHIKVRLRSARVTDTHRYG